MTHYLEYVRASVCFLIYDTGMLEDLEILKQRLSKLIESVQDLSAEKQSLQARLSQSEDLCRSLQSRLDEGEQKAQALHSQVSQCQSELDGLRKQSTTKHNELQGTLDLFKQEHSSMQTQLHQSEHEIKVLREASLQAKARIDAVLMRLPGASPTEEQS